MVAIGGALLLTGWFVVRGGGGSSLPEPPESEALAINQAPSSDTTTPSPSPRSTPVRRAGAEPAPAITGQAAYVMEEPCGVMLYSLAEEFRLPPASLTKMMTAIVAAEQLDPAAMIDVSVNGPELSIETDSTVMGLEPGDRLSVRDLLYGLLLRSGNDAALTLAEAAAGSQGDFVDMMNDKAEELGLEETTFRNPHGLDADGHYSSASDMAAVGSTLLANPLLTEIVATQTYTPNWPRGPLENINLMLSNYPGAIGVKTGYTDGAGQAIVAAAERDGRRLIVSVLRSEDLFVDASKLLDWGFATTPAC
jgi:D-alanyl-D-alanine carboxypeptidase